MTLTLESIVVALAITFLLPFALAAAFGYFLVFVPTVFAPSELAAKGPDRMPSTMPARPSILWS